MEKVVLNKLPVPTYGWLGVNGTERDAAVLDAESKSFDVTSDSDEYARIDVSEDGRYDVNITAAAGKTAQAVVYTSAGNAAVTVNVKAESGSKVRLVQVYDDNASVISKTDARVEDNALFEIVQLYLGGADTVSEINAALDGRKSALRCDIGYRLGGSEKLDLNIVSTQRGKKTQSEIDVKGVMDGDAQKIFRGTIDFIKGAAGSTGAETEEVLMMSENARNKTVPLILCGEEDVEGSHGATIGRINEEHIFYMQSRGIPADEICRIMAAARIEQIIKKIDDEETVRRIRKTLPGSEKDE